MSDLTVNNFSYYEKKIISNFFADGVGIDFDKFGVKSFEKIIPVDLNSIDLLDERKLKSEIVEVINLIQAKKYNNRPIWFRTNVIDQAVNDYVGIGLFNVNEEWVKYIIYSLSLDRADQSGDTIFTIFDKDFQWVINFELSQDNSTLTVQKYTK